ncbi:MAG: sulfite exporter TauE/SafE family protein [Elusimicrobiales bacterium]
MKVKEKVASFGTTSNYPLSINYIIFAKIYLMDRSLLILGVLVFVAGFVDSIAGGGGLITLPAYLNYGVDENLLLGTNKLSSTIGTAAAVIKYLDEIRFSAALVLTLFISATLFSFLGAYFISLLPSYLVKMTLFLFLPPLSFYIIRRKDFGVKDTSEMITESEKLTKIFIISSLISFYDGMMGPGTGTFLAIGYSKFVGYDILKSTVLAKLTNLISNISALITFLYLERVNLWLGASMGLVSVIGNYFGANMTLKKGVWIIKPMIAIISNIILLKLILETLKSL